MSRGSGGEPLRVPSMSRCGDIMMAILLVAVVVLASPLSIAGARAEEGEASRSLALEAWQEYESLTRRSHTAARDGMPSEDYLALAAELGEARRHFLRAFRKSDWDGLDVTVPSELVAAGFEHAFWDARDRGDVAGMAEAAADWLDAQTRSGPEPPNLVQHLLEVYAHYTIAMTPVRRTVASRRFAAWDRADDRQMAMSSRYLHALVLMSAGEMASAKSILAMTPTEKPAARFPEFFESQSALASSAVMREMESLGGRVISLAELRWMLDSGNEAASSISGAPILLFEIGDSPDLLELKELLQVWMGRLSEREGGRVTILVCLVDVDASDVDESLREACMRIVDHLPRVESSRVVVAAGSAVPGERGQGRGARDMQMLLSRDGRVDFVAPRRSTVDSVEASAMAAAVAKLR